MRTNGNFSSGQIRFCRRCNFAPTPHQRFVYPHPNPNPTKKFAFLFQVWGCCRMIYYTIELRFYWLISILNGRMAPPGVKDHVITFLPPLFCGQSNQNLVYSHKFWNVSDAPKVWASNWSCTWLHHSASNMTRTQRNGKETERERNGWFFNMLAVGENGTLHSDVVAIGKAVKGGGSGLSDIFFWSLVL